MELALFYSGHRMQLGTGAENIVCESVRYSWQQLSSTLLAELWEVAECSHYVSPVIIAMKSSLLTGDKKEGGELEQNLVGN